MRRILVGLAILAMVPTVSTAQQRPVRFELVPFAGFMFGGGYDLDVGKIEAEDGLGYGGTISFNMRDGHWLDFTYIRQDADLDVTGPGFSGDEDLALSLNYITIGGHREFAQYGAPLKPYIGGSAGMVIYDPEALGEDLENTTRFTLGLNGGFKFLFGEEQRFGIRTDLRVLWSWVPGDDYGYWCSYYGCFVTQETETVAQGLASAGLILRF